MSTLRELDCLANLLRHKLTSSIRWKILCLSVTFFLAMHLLKVFSLTILMTQMGRFYWHQSYRYVLTIYLLANFFTIIICSDASFGNI